MNRFAEDLIQSLREALAHAKGTGKCAEHGTSGAVTQSDAAAYFAARTEDGNAQSAITYLRNAPDIEPDPEDRIT